MDSAQAYENIAIEFMRGRDRSPIGEQVIRQWCQTLPQKADVIELGCGAGYPVTRELHAGGMQLWAVDCSPTLLRDFSERFSEIPVQCSRVQECDFFNRTFDAAVAIGLKFLLPEAEQEELINRVAGILVPGGRFLMWHQLRVVYGMT